MEKLNKNEIIELVAEKAHLSKVDAKSSVDMTFDLIMEALLKGDSVNIRNFCVFEPKTKAGRKEATKRQKIMIQFLTEFFREQAQNKWIVYLEKYLKNI